MRTRQSEKEKGSMLVVDDDLTARQSMEAEDRIRHAAEEWRVLFDSIDDPVSIHDKDFKILRVNKAFAAAFGLEIKDLLGKKCYEVIHGTRGPRPGCPHQQALISGNTASAEFFEPGQGKFLHVSASPIRDDDNEIVNSVHILRDITERRRAKEALQAAHDELEARVKERTADLAAANKRLIASEKALEDRLKFETLLAEISAGFVNLPVDRIDKVIHEAQRRLCEFHAFDRSTLWQTSEENPGRILLTHIHHSRGSWPEPGKMESRDFFPWTTTKVLNGEILAISSMADLPTDAARDLETFCTYGTQSTLLFPLSTGGEKVFGVLSFAVTQREREWPEPIVNQLQLVAELFSNVLARKNADEALRESEERLRLATDAAGAGLWIIDPDADQLWLTVKTRELLQLSSQKELNFESFLKVIDPGYHNKVRQDVRETVQSGKDLRSEYRVVLPDGKIRWILCIGRVYPKPNGESKRLMGVFVDITERKMADEQLKAYIREIEQLKERLYKENLYLQNEIKLLDEHSEIIGQSLAMKKILAQVKQVAQTDSTVLILGETGTGKELLARAIHRMSQRRSRPLVSVNCASLPPLLIESELFGRERGAYTGALTKMIGRFEISDGSTLFLDEIGEVPLELQSKLLRVLETGNFERLGSTKNLHADVRIIAATNRDIDQEVENGGFRKDLFYRLNVFPILIPPLRERPEDIPLMVWAFVKEFQQKMGKKIETVSKQTMETLQSYSWPGNVRELRNVIERAMIMSTDSTLVIQLPRPASSKITDSRNLEDMEREHIISVLDKCLWRVGGTGGAAEVLGLKRSTLYSKMEKLGINRPNV